VESSSATCGEASRQEVGGQRPAQWRPGELYCAGGRGSRAGSRGVPEEEERREGSEGLMCKTRKSRVLSVK
jgi:hypothetical protein